MSLLERILKLTNENKYVRVWFHVFFWIFYWLITYYFNTISLNIFSKTFLAWLEPLCNVLNLILFYYPFMYIIVPFFLKKKRYLIGIIFLLTQIIIYALLSEIQERFLIEHCITCKDILAQMPASITQSLQQSLFIGITSSLLSFGIIFVLIAKLSPVMAFKISIDLVKAQKTAIELEKVNILLEFNFLKSQVNPHFLFNTLNNIHSLIFQDRRKDASATISKLSDFLRYSLYESGKEWVKLSKEIKLINDYIELEKLRLNKTDVSFSSNTNNDDIEIPPLLFIPLVENAFKYTADTTFNKSFINIRIELKNKILKFQITNNYDASKRNNNGGIGLSNLKKRLLNYYPTKHLLEITDSENVHKVKIQIKL